MPIIQIPFFSKNSPCCLVTLKSGEISKEDYDRWRYRYPEFDTTGHWHKVVPSQGLSDMLVEELKKQPGKDK